MTVEDCSILTVLLQRMLIVVKVWPALIGLAEILGHILQCDFSLAVLRKRNASIKKCVKNAKNYLIETHKNTVFYPDTLGLGGK